MFVIMDTANSILDSSTQILNTFKPQSLWCKENLATYYFGDKWDGSDSAW